MMCHSISFRAGDGVITIPQRGPPAKSINKSEISMQQTQNLLRMPNAHDRLDPWIDDRDRIVRNWIDAWIPWIFSLVKDQAFGRRFASLSVDTCII